uniref:ORF1 n=1 Tax=Azorhizobium caulinodans TaxID=7 RepID=Q43969_AZOCA|nr:ORF1 [Azorhizobium caulinodans ORS 571]
MGAVMSARRRTDIRLRCARARCGWCWATRGIFPLVGGGGGRWCRWPRRSGGRPRPPTSGSRRRCRRGLASGRASDVAEKMKALEREAASCARPTRFCARRRPISPRRSSGSGPASRRG